MNSGESEYFVDAYIADDPKKSVVVIYEQIGDGMKVVNSFSGSHAESFIDILVGNKKVEV